ncbi:MAG: histidine--tRNA ligase [Deltaproteobacteria bacterium RBG_13_43_22]|nr:MAG: histidine--tRNA ligase [Deltaproteobacteria bacterium RBG_13_43_22]
MAIQALKGFKDILPGESEKWVFMEETARRIFRTFGFSEIRTPVLEKTDLFVRSIGTSTDIVEKEMYTLIDRSGDSITLRPEATASVMRAFIEHNLQGQQPIHKLFSIGPMFRHERPQKGRLRQFHQINAEYIGTNSPFADAELIYLLMQILDHLGLLEIRLRLNSLGCPLCRPSFNSALQGFLGERQSELCPDCQRRMSTNPLRVFDCKVERCQELLTAAPTITDFVCRACQEHFEQVQKLISGLSIPIHRDPRLVRGLDYYTRTTFEISASHLGSQDAVAGGGRYDGLIRQLGGADMPAIGFAIGLERMALLLSSQEEWINRPFVFLIPLGAAAREKAFSLLTILYKKEIPAMMDYEDKSLKSQLKRADKVKSRFAAILGTEELNKDRILIRNLDTQSQEAIPIPQFLDYFLERYLK